jgi:hypothetical protein
MPEKAFPSPLMPANACCFQGGCRILSVSIRATGPGSVWRLISIPLLKSFRIGDLRNRSVPESMMLKVVLYSHDKRDGMYKALI